MSEHCPVCGTPVKVVGHTTMHYEPIENLERLDENKLWDACDSIFPSESLIITNSKMIRNFKAALIKEICSKFGHQKSVSLEQKELIPILHEWKCGNKYSDITKVYEAIKDLFEEGE